MRCAWLPSLEGRSSPEPKTKNAGGVDQLLDRILSSALPRVTISVEHSIASSRKESGARNGAMVIRSQSNAIGITWHEF